MAINTEISRIQTAKINLKAAIEAKGVTVPSDALIDSYDDYVSAIPSGGNKMGQFIDVDPSATYSGDYNIMDYVKEAIVPEGITSIQKNTGFLQGFYYCRNLASVSLPSTLTYIGAKVFDSCGLLPSIIIPPLVTSIGSGAFRKCTSLTAVTFAAPSSVRAIDTSAFFGCSALTAITIPSTVTSIGQSAFNTCTALTSFTCEAITPPTLSGNIFVDDTNLAHIYVPNESVETYKVASVWSDYASIIEAIPTAE